jgi:hypothetical protein
VQRDPQVLQGNLSSLVFLYYGNISLIKRPLVESLGFFTGSITAGFSCFRLTGNAANRSSLAAWSWLSNFCFSSGEIGGRFMGWGMGGGDGDVAARLGSGMGSWASG